MLSDRPASRQALSLPEGAMRLGRRAHHDSVHELPKLTSLVDGKRRIVEISDQANTRAMASGS